MAVYDLFGKKVQQQTVNQSYSTLKMDELAQGVYILKVWLSQGEMVIRKVVKE
ncbi:MAG: T9SS type A sorting domain-containing protein [Bacteroidales bacterium]|nr:T9SS type A sorting domain-containing protein [Bacteroidales bacterium]